VVFLTVVMVTHPNGTSLTLLALARLPTGPFSILITRQGTPATRLYDSTSRLTRLPAATIAFAPNSTHAGEELKRFVSAATPRIAPNTLESLKGDLRAKFWRFDKRR
jgi:hypothetical protein